MADIVRRFALVAASFCVVFAALMLASNGEGDALPGVERAFTAPVEPEVKADERLAAGLRFRPAPAAPAPAVPVPAPTHPSDPRDDHARLLAWSRAYAGIASALPEPLQASSDLALLMEGTRQRER